MGDKFSKLNYKKMHLNSFLILTVCSFIYSLGFSTNFRVLRASHRPLYDLAQSTNRVMFNLSIIGIILAVIMMMSGYKNKKRVDKKQKLIISIIGIYSIINAKLSISAIGSFKKVYIENNFDKLDEYTASSNLFGLGIFISLLLTVSFIFFTCIVLKKKNKQEVIQ